ncbi:hypothetical protein Tco_0360969 [Tanacetum coccineum]
MERAPCCYGLIFVFLRGTGRRSLYFSLNHALLLAATSDFTVDHVDLLKKHAVDVRAEIRRQSTTELQIFKQRWENAVEEDTTWVDPFYRRKQRRN